MSDTLIALIRHHRLAVPDETRSDSELEAYYRGLRNSSPFVTLASMIEATPSVLEMREARRALYDGAAKVVDVCQARFVGELGLKGLDELEEFGGQEALNDLKELNFQVFLKIREENAAMERNLSYMLPKTYSFLIDRLGVCTNIRIDVSLCRVKIWVSHSVDSPCYKGTPYLDKTGEEFVVWFNSNVRDM